MSALSVNTTATDPDIEGMRLRWVIIWYLAVLPALWVVPPIFKCCRRRLRSRRSATEHSPMTDVTNAVTSVTAAQLEAAEQARKRLQLRVKGALLPGKLCTPQLYSYTHAHSGVHMRRG